MATEGKSRTGGLWVPALDGVRGYLSISIALAHVMLATGWTPQHELPLALQASTFLAIDFLFLISGFVAFLPVVATRSFPASAPTRSAAPAACCRSTTS